MPEIYNESIDNWDYVLSAVSTPWEKGNVCNASINIPGNFLNLTLDDIVQRASNLPDVGLPWEVTFNIAGVLTKECRVHIALYGSGGGLYNNPYFVWDGASFKVYGYGWTGQDVGTTATIIMRVFPVAQKRQLWADGVPTTLFADSILPSNWHLPLFYTILKGGSGDNEAVKIYAMNYKTGIVDVPLATKQDKFKNQGDILMGL